MADGPSPPAAPACSSCGHPVAEHLDSWEWREEVNMRRCRVSRCDCRLFWERGEEPPD